MMAEEEYVNISKKDNGIATIEFYHPQSNSLPGLILKKIADSIPDWTEVFLTFEKEINFILNK